MHLERAADTLPNRPLPQGLPVPLEKTEPDINLNPQLADLPRPSVSHVDGFTVSAASDESAESRVDEIEMIGEEMAAGMRQTGRLDITPGMRFLHCSRTIHQLVSDRNRAVGIYLAVASLTWTASATLLNAKPTGQLIVPIEAIQRWCVPLTALILTVLAVFTAFLLIRTRIGLIYEVAKMNILLGLPIGRVRRINPLSIFFIMHLLISLAGGANAAILAYHLCKLGNPDGRGHLMISLAAGLCVVVLLVVLYVIGVIKTTDEKQLQSATKGA